MDPVRHRRLFRRANLPAPTVVDVPLGAGGNAPNPGGDPFTNPDGEVALDIQVAAAAYSVATGKPATIRVYWANASDWGSMATAIAAAAADGCDVCSISWGTDEANWQAAGEAAGVDLAGQLNAAAKAAAARRHDRLCGVGRQQFERRRTDARQRRSALVIAVRRRLRRHVEAARGRRGDRVEQRSGQSERLRDRRQLFDNLHADAPVAGGSAARAGPNGSGRRGERRRRIRLRHRRPR